jgi:hypothetical protein
MKKRTRTGLMLLLLAASPEALPQYKCIVNGQTTYSERPCGPNAVNLDPKAPEARPARRSDEQEVAPAARPRIPQTTQTVTPVTIERPPTAPRAAAQPSTAKVQEDRTLSIVLAGFAVFLYFAPAINARLRRHNSTAAIVCLNILLGWTFLGWVLSLVWSYSGPSNQRTKKAKGPVVACANCGQTVGQNAQFCENCGSGVTARSRLSV